MTDFQMLKKMVLTLFVITAIAATLLAGVYELTKAPIKAVEQAKMATALVTVLPSFDSNPTDKMYKLSCEGDSLICYPVYSGANFCGMAIKTFANGFSGKINLMVGFKPDGTIYNTSVISHSETPGLGDKIDIKKSKFPSFFNGINPQTNQLKVKSDGGSIDAITASTISSRAFCVAVQRASDAFEKERSKF